MARLSRLEVVGQPHLVIQRGAGGCAVFVDDADRRDYLEALAASARTCGVAIHAYALTDDSIFLLATPSGPGALGSCMQRLGRRYVAAFNRRHARTGSLWAGRFGAAPIEPERYLLACMKFVEQAPVRCGAVAEPQGWRWSSARHHAGLEPNSWITEHSVYWSTGNTPFEREARYDRELRRPIGDTMAAELGGAVRRGWPLGSAAFVAAIAGEGRSRPLQPRPRGRPRRAKRE
jgi:putative transposase